MIFPGVPRRRARWRRAFSELPQLLMAHQRRERFLLRSRNSRQHASLAQRRGRAASGPPGRYFRMHPVGYFEGIVSERGLEWRCSDSLSLREFLRLESRDRVPDHSWLSRTRTRLPHEVHEAVFDWVLALIAEARLVQGDSIGVDASTKRW